MAISRWMDKEDAVHIYNEILVLLLFSCSVVSDSLRPHGLQHARLPCPSPSPRACSNSCPLSRWGHPTILSSFISFSSWLQSFSASKGLSFLMSRFFESGGQSNGILLSHKKNEIMPFAATWMDLKIVILNEVSQTEKGKYHMILLICGIYGIPWWFSW